jgi:hypothetical protein
LAKQNDGFFDHVTSTCEVPEKVKSLPEAALDYAHGRDNEGNKRKSGNQSFHSMQTGKTDE